MTSLDLDKLRRQIAAAPADGPAYQVDRAFLEKVEREVSLGRQAKAQLAAKEQRHAS